MQVYAAGAASGGGDRGRLRNIGGSSSAASTAAAAGGGAAAGSAGAASGGEGIQHYMTAVWTCHNSDITLEHLLCGQCSNARTMQDWHAYCSSCCAILAQHSLAASGRPPIF
jgi:hypothetical protein